MKTLLLILGLLLCISGCSYVFPDSTSIKPATTDLHEKTEQINPPEQQEIFEETIVIERGGE